MAKRSTKIVSTLGAVLLALVLVVFIGRSYILDIARDMIAQELGRRSGKRVTIERLGGGVWGDLRLEGIEFRSEGELRARVGAVEVVYSPFHLLRSPHRLRGMVLDEPELILPTGWGASSQEEGVKEREAGEFRSLPILVDHLQLRGGTGSTSTAISRRRGSPKRRWISGKSENREKGRSPSSFVRDLWSESGR